MSGGQRDGLSRRARAALRAIHVVVAPDGTFQISALRLELGTQERNTMYALAELVAAGLVRRTGHTRAAVHRVVVLLHNKAANNGQGSGGKTSSKEWRQERARLGGLERALREVQAQRDHAKQEADALRRGRRLAADPALVGLLADLTHASDCASPSCRRCEAISRAVEAGRAEYVTEGEIVETLEQAAGLKRAGAELVAALGDRGVGAMQRRDDAIRAFVAAMNTTDELRASP